MTRSQVSVGRVRRYRTHGPRDPSLLDPDEQALHLREMASVAAAVQRAVGAPRMNYEALGNSVLHLHWWLMPRRSPTSP